MTLLPPGPRLPPVVQVAFWALRPVPFMEACARKFGASFTIRFPFQPPMVFTSDPEAVREIFAAEPDRVHAGSANVILEPLVGEYSLLILDGDRHRTERRRLAPPFQAGRMREQCTLIRDVAARHVERWPRGRVFAVHHELQKITLEVILRAIFGIEDEARIRQLSERLVRLLGFTSSPAALLTVGASGKMLFTSLHRALGPLSPFGRFLRLKAAVEELFTEELASRPSREAGRPDVLSLLLEAREAGVAPLSDEELRDHMMTLVVAGHETTATVLAWTLHRLLTHPEVLARVRAELEEVTAGAPLAADHVPRLKYLEAVVKETLRLDPILPMVVRLLKSPQRFGELELPAGVIAAPNVFLTHRRSDLWPDPESFRPERFLDSPPRPHHFFPFGGGARTCLGMAFAYYEMKIILAEILARRRLSLAPGYRLRRARRSITFAPSRGLPLVAEVAVSRPSA